MRRSTLTGNFMPLFIANHLPLTILEGDPRTFLSLAFQKHSAPFYEKDFGPV